MRRKCCPVNYSNRNIDEKTRGLRPKENTMKPFAFDPEKRPSTGCCPGHDEIRCYRWSGRYSSASSRRADRWRNKKDKRARRRRDRQRLQKKSRDA